MMSGVRVPVTSLAAARRPRGTRSRGLPGAGQARWLDQLEAEHANLQAALRWASQPGDTEMALLLAARRWRFWQLRGIFAEGRRWLEDVLAAEGPACSLPGDPLR